MFDISKLSNEELLNYQYDYLIRHCIEDIEEIVQYIEVSDKGLLACELHNLLLKYDHGY